MGEQEATPVMHAVISCQTSTLTGKEIRVSCLCKQSTTWSTPIVQAMFEATEVEWNQTFAAFPND